MARVALLISILGLVAQEDRAKKAHEEATAWLVGLEKAELTFLQISPEQEEKPGTFHGYPVLLQKPIKEGKIADELRSLLADRKTYSSLEHKCFDPGMGIRFKADGKESDLLICLSCQAILAVKADGGKYWLLSDEGKDRLRKIYDAFVPPDPKK
jgi:hypothetical protein